MVHNFVNTSAERPSLFSLFLLPKKPFGFMDKYFLRKVEIRMKMKHHSKPGVKLKTALQPIRQSCSKCKEVMNDRGHQRQKIPYRIVRRGC